jgi:hypothetical protein
MENFNKSSLIIGRDSLSTEPLTILVQNVCVAIVPVVWSITSEIMHMKWQTTWFICLPERSKTLLYMKWNISKVGKENSLGMVLLRSHSKQASTVQNS